MAIFDFSPHDGPAHGVTQPTSQAAAPVGREPGQTATLSRLTLTAADGVGLSVLVAQPEVPAAGLPPVLAIHGYASSASACWGRTGHLEALARAGRTVFAVDLRGHGESGKPHDAAAYSLDQILADLAKAAEAVTDRWPNEAATSVGPATMDVIGYSLGSRLAWTAVARGVLSARRMVLGGFDGRPLFDGADPQRLERLAAGVPTNDVTALGALVTGLAGTGSDGLPEHPSPVPVLIVAGDRDPLATEASRFVASLPDASFLSVAGRNHISTVPSRTYRQAEVEFLAVSAGT